MRKIVFIFSLCIGINSFSQNNQILYNFTGTPQSLMLNPGADVKYNWYAGIPMLSGISLNVNMSTISPYDLFAKNDVPFTTKLKKALSTISSSDHLYLNQKVEIFNGGFRIGYENKDFISFGMYEEFDFIGYFPNELVSLSLEGNKSNIGKTYSLADLSAKAELLSVFHIGYNKRVNDALIYGVRGKIYSSILNLNSTKNEGYVKTFNSNSTYYSQTILSDLTINTSGLSETNSDTPSITGSKIMSGLLLGGNLGFGIDLGATYYPSSDIQITGSIIDLGFISHSKDVITYTYKGFYDNKGLVVDPSLLTAITGNNIDLKTAIVSSKKSEKYITWRPLKLNSSIQYSFGYEVEETLSCSCIADSDRVKDYDNTVGLQAFMMMTPKDPLYAFTTYYLRKFSESLHLKATYTLDYYSSKNLGLGLSTKLGHLNFYVVADNLLSYSDISKTNGLSFQTGLNLIF